MKLQRKRAQLLRNSNKTNQTILLLLSCSNENALNLGECNTYNMDGATTVTGNFFNSL